METLSIKHATCDNKYSRRVFFLLYTVGFWQSVVTEWLPDWHLFTYGREPYRNNWRFSHGEFP